MAEPQLRRALPHRFPRRPQAAGDRAAGGAELRGRRPRGSLAEVALPRRLQRARGAGAAHGRLRGRRHGCGRSCTARRCREMVVPYGDPAAATSARTPSTSASTASACWPTRWRWAATASARSATSTPGWPTARATRTASRTRSACTRRTTASSGSTPTGSPARSRCGAPAGWCVSSIATVGNYEYGFYWYFYQDGSIQFEMKLTGIVNTAGADAGRDAALTATHRGARRLRASTTSTSSTCGSTWRSTASATRSSRSTPWRCPRARTTRTATPSACGETVLATRAAGAAQRRLAAARGSGGS